MKLARAPEFPGAYQYTLGSIEPGARPIRRTRGSAGGRADAGRDSEKSSCRTAGTGHACDSARSGFLGGTGKDLGDETLGGLGYDRFDRAGYILWLQHPRGILPAVW